MQKATAVLLFTEQNQSFPATSISHLVQFTLQCIPANVLHRVILISSSRTRSPRAAYVKIHTLLPCRSRSRHILNSGGRKSSSRRKTLHAPTLLSRKEKMISDISSQSRWFNHRKCPINATFIEPSIDIAGAGGREKKCTPIPILRESAQLKTQTFLIAGI